MFKGLREALEHRPTLGFCRLRDRGDAATFAGALAPRWGSFPILRAEVTGAQDEPQCQVTRWAREHNTATSERAIVEYRTGARDRLRHSLNPRMITQLALA